MTLSADRNRAESHRKPSNCCRNGGATQPPTPLRTLSKLAEPPAEIAAPGIKYVDIRLMMGDDAVGRVLHSGQPSAHRSERRHALHFRQLAHCYRD